MYYGVAKIMIEWETTTKSDERLIHQLVESVRKKFKIASLALYDSIGIPAGIAVAMLAAEENHLNKKIDSVVRHCEEFGIGRVSWERALVDHIDSIEEE